MTYYVIFFAIPVTLLLSYLTVELLRLLYLLCKDVDGTSKIEYEPLIFRWMK